MKRIKIMAMAAAAVMACSMMSGCGADFGSSKVTYAYLDENDKLAFGKIDEAEKTDSENRSLEYIVVDDYAYYIYPYHVEIDQYIGTDTEIVVPSEYKGLPVTRICNEAFMGCDLKSVVIPEGVKSLGSFCFSYPNLNPYMFDREPIEGDMVLEPLVLPDSVETIGDYAFYGRIFSEKTLEMPDSLKIIGKSAFSRCEEVEEIVLNEGLEEIQCGAFLECKNLEKVHIPDSVTTYGDSIFSRCTNLKDIKLSENATEIAEFMFSGCESLEQIEIPACVTEMDNTCFIGTPWIENEDTPKTINGIKIK